MRPAKRRRTDVANVVPNKPFRSPMRVDRGKPAAPVERCDDKDSQSSQTSTPIGPSSHSESSPSVTSMITKATLSNPLERTQHLNDTGASFLEISATDATRHDKDYAVLQKQYRSLSLQLKELTRSLDTVSQALNIVQSSQSGRLEGLIKKWQAISREAAENLFSTAVGHVHQMGGYEAWLRDSSNSRMRHQWDDNIEPGDDALSSEQRERLEISEQEAESECGKTPLEEDNVSPEEREIESFTMDVMLRQLHIDPNLLGYDVQTQSWIE